MCTAAVYKTKDFYFGRTLDIEYSYDETITITPRRYPFTFRREGVKSEHFAIIGAAAVIDNYPLYYDAINEKGLCMAGLNFPQNAFYPSFKEGADNISPFEFIPWILSQCADANEAERLLLRINLINIPFSEKLPLAPLHWIIADKNRSLTVESVKDGLKIYENPVGILTNNPAFDIQLFNLNNYMGISPNSPKNTFSDKLKLKTYSRGMGGLGLPGDLSSMSRFVKAAYTKLNSCSKETEAESISQFFHILGSVCQQKGCVLTEDGEYEFTHYTSCCNADKGIYYYTTYENSRICAVNMHKENLSEDRLISYPIIKSQQIKYQN